MFRDSHDTYHRLSPAAFAQLVADIIFLVLIIALLVTVMHKAKSGEDDNLYAEAATVTTINEMRGYTGFTDERGREVYIYEIGDWSPGDIVFLLIDSNGTDYLYDDEVVSVSMLMYAPVA